MLFSPAPLFASASAFAVNSHLRFFKEAGATAANHTTQSATIPSTAKGAVLCLVEVDGTGGSLTARAADVRIDNASGAQFTYRSSLYNSVQDHIISFWTISDIPTGSHAIYVDHNGAEVGTDVQMSLVLFDTNITFEAAAFSSLVLENGATDFTNAVSLSSLTSADKVFVAFPYESFGANILTITEDTSSDYTAEITAWGNTGDHNTWDVGSGNTGQEDQTACGCFHWLSKGGIASETFTASFTNSVLKNRRVTCGLIAVTEAA